MKNKEFLNTEEIITRLSAKYSSPNFGFITQVRNGTGYMSNRTADAMAMSLWPSRGLHVYGFEVKASRTDWIKELKQPEKADAMAIYCHYWYLVVGNEDLVKLEELPKTWGLIVPCGKGLKVIKEAEFNKDALQFDSLMLAGIFRNVADYCVPKELVDIKIKKEAEARSEGWRKNYEDEKKEKQKLQDIINDFESKTDLRIYNWDKESNKELIAAVKIALQGSKKIENVKKKLDGLKNIGDRIGKYIDGELQEYQI